MLWIFFALLAHVANGAVFIIDKSLLGGKSTLRKPLHYALYSAALAGLVVIILPFAHVVFTSFVLTWSLVAGAVHILALLVFFTAMRLGEPSRIVPITGSAVPLFTILFAVFFLGEVFTSWQVMGILLLIAGGGFLSIGRSEKKVIQISWKNLSLALLAGALFAIYFVVTKYIYTYANDEFLSVFMTTRIVEAVIAIMAIVVFIGVRMPSGAKRKQQGSRKAQGVFFLNKILAAGAFLLQTYAISLGSVSVVNALQGVQFAFIFLLAILFSWAFPAIFREEIRRDALVQKSIGIILISIGITLIV
jgi:drug/metabolite transporter (DMT)-like permease